MLPAASALSDLVAGHCWAWLSASELCVGPSLLSTLGACMLVGIAVAACGVCAAYLGDSLWLIFVGYGSDRTAARGRKQALATVRFPAAEIHCRKGEATQIDWQDLAGWPTVVFHPP